MDHQDNSQSEIGRSGDPVWNTISFRRLAQKELRETLRDRRTIATLFLMPLLVYPILSLLFQSFLFSSLAPSAGGDAQDNRFLVLFENEAERRGAATYLRRWWGQKNEDARVADRQEQQLPMDFDSQFVLKTKDEFGGASLVELMEGNFADLGIERGVMNSGVNGRSPPRSSFRLIHRNDSARSLRAKQAIADVIDWSNRYRYQQRFPQPEKGKVTQTFYSSVAVTVPKRARAISIAALVPLILTLMTITGAIYPAIDLTAGERERGTLESLVAAPIPRIRILLAKLFAVVSVAMLTAILNLAGMMATIWVFQLETVLFGEQGLSVLVIAQVFGLLILFAGFFSSVLLVITSFAKSFKEGQAYLIPVMLVALAPGMLSLSPDMKLEGFWMVTPLVNIVLLSRDVLQGNASLAAAAVTVVATVIYSVLALTLAARFFGTASVLYGETQGINLVFQRPKTRQTRADASLAMVCLALLFPASFLWQGVVTRVTAADASQYSAVKSEFLAEAHVSSVDQPGEAQQVALAQLSKDQLSRQLGLTAMGVALIFFITPYLFTRYYRVQFLPGFQLRRPPWRCLLAGILLGFGLGALLMQAIASSSQWFEYCFGAIGEELVHSAKAYLEKLRQIDPWVVFVCIAIVPAVCEELFFRGLLFRALRRNLSPLLTILSTGVLFGAFHLVSSGGLGMSRLLPTAAMGFVLGWVCHRSGSVVPSMILHAIHNGLATFLSLNRDRLETEGWIQDGQTDLPLWVLAAGVALTLVGGILLYMQKIRPDLDDVNKLGVDGTLPDVGGSLNSNE